MSRQDVFSYNFKPRGIIRMMKGVGYMIHKLQINVLIQELVD